jgi:hypothetical protein
LEQTDCRIDKNVRWSLETSNKLDYYCLFGTIYEAPFAVFIISRGRVLNANLHGSPVGIVRKVAKLTIDTKPIIEPRFSERMGAYRLHRACPKLSIAGLCFLLVLTAGR